MMTHLDSKEPKLATSPRIKAANRTTSSWTEQEVLALFEKGLMELLWEAQNIHRQYHSPNKIELATLLSVKTGGCPENCSYCPQSKHFETGIDNEPLLELETVLTAARQAKKQGAQRFCMGAAWRSPTEK